jgi:hypothetical protein
MLLIEYKIKQLVFSLVVSFEQLKVVMFKFYLIIFHVKLRIVTGCHDLSKIKSIKLERYLKKTEKISKPTSFLFYRLITYLCRVKNLGLGCIDYFL